VLVKSPIYSRRDISGTKRLQLAPGIIKLLITGLRVLCTYPMPTSNIFPMDLVNFVLHVRSGCFFTFAQVNINLSVLAMKLAKMIGFRTAFFAFRSVLRLTMFMLRISYVNIQVSKGQTNNVNIV